MNWDKAIQQANQFLGLCVRCALAALVIASVLYLLSAMGQYLNRDYVTRMHEMEKTVASYERRVARLETRMAGQAAATDHIYQILDGMEVE